MNTVVESDIVIVGGGICGLATALALHRKKIKSLVLEKSEQLRATGAAIIVQANGWHALDQLGVGSILRQTAIQIQGGKFISISDDGQKEAPFGINQEFRCLKRTDLINTLANCLPMETIRTSSQVVSIELDSATHYPQLLLSNGSILQAKVCPKSPRIFASDKVVIGCDGVNSIIANMAGLHQTKLLSFSTCVARGFTNYQNGHQFPSEFAVLGRGQVQLGMIPMTHKLVYWFITRLSTSQDSTISRDSNLIRQSLMESMEGFPLYAMDMIQSCELNSLHLTNLKYRPPWDLLLSKFHKGTIVIAGDAMHVTGPFIAQGGSASIEDAIVLARCLAQKMHNTKNMMIERSIVSKAFDEYVKERRMRVFWLSFNSFLVGKKLDAKSWIVRFIVIAIMVVLFRDPEWHLRYKCGTLHEEEGDYI